jgi:hypothetical protein
LTAPASRLRAGLLAAAIVGRGEYAEVPSSSVVRSAGGGRFVLQQRGTDPIQGDAVLELFADRHRLGPAHRVYYYETTQDSGRGLLVVLAATETYSVKRAEAWVLVDEESETVVDAVFREDR